MPTPSTSHLPKPKSWDEFEDIIWNIYTRRWQDIHAQRYGRSGQSQNGVDIYGQHHASKGYIAIQCKCYADNKLNQQTILADLEKTEKFSSSISEYIIATTASRDINTQDIVRDLNEKRQSENKFSIRVIFWEEICSYLAEPQNHDLLEKYYSEWGLIFSKTAKNINPDRKRWRNIEILNFPVISDSEASREIFMMYLAKGLKIAFEEEGYIEFISLISKFTTTTPQPIVVYQVISHKAKFCHTVRRIYHNLLKEIHEIKLEKFSKDREATMKEDIKLRFLTNNDLPGWSFPANIFLSPNPIAHKFIFDPDTQCISISRIAESVWKEEPSTSDLMVMLSCLLNYQIGILQDIENLSRVPKLTQLFVDWMDHKPINYDNFRINVDDDEDWDYLGCHGGTISFRG